MQILLCWRTLPGAGETNNETFDLTLRNDELLSLRFALTDESVKKEDCCSQQQEVKKRFAYDSFYHFSFSQPHHFAGVYQMGEVYARSVVIIVTSGAIFTPNLLASYAVQRGVGISMTRP